MKVYIVTLNHRINSVYADKIKAINDALSIPCAIPGGWIKHSTYNYWYNGTEVLSIQRMEVIK